MKALVFRTLVRLYQVFERRWLVRWHPDYQRAFIRIMVGVKRRLFPKQGQSDLSQWIDVPLGLEQGMFAQSTFLGGTHAGGSYQLAQGPCADVVIQRLLKHASHAPANEGWLWLERENLMPVSCHQGLGAFDWNQLVAAQLPQFVSHRPAVEKLICLLIPRNVSHVLMVPWLRRGGADKAAIGYLQLLGQRFPGRVLLITTEPGHSPWLTRMPAGCEIVEWAEIDQWPDTNTSMQELAAVLYALQPKVFHVMNSWLGWELLRCEGARLRSIMSTWTSLFWYGPSDHGQLRGYAAEFLPRVERWLDGVITDNASFPLRLQRDYGFQPELFHCVYHPTAHIAEVPVFRSGAKECLRVLWASRFCPEKRMDLLLAIASARPQHKFFVYGAVDGEAHGLVETLACLQALPNVVLCGAYDGFESLPVDDYDVFLYTSSSDGMPNTVIEAMAHGIPLIASDVGGVSELVDDTTGWLVTRIDETGDYLIAIDDVLAKPEEGQLRAGMALHRVRERHSFEAFEHMLESVPGYLKR